MRWKDLPRSGFHELPSEGPEECKKGYVTGTQVMDRLIAVFWGPETLLKDDAALWLRVLECVKLLVSEAENECIEGFVECGAEMRPLQPTDWSERTPEQWREDLLESKLDRGPYEPTSWANGKILMFEREPVAEWIYEASQRWGKDFPGKADELPPLPDKAPASTKARIQVFTDGVKWWKTHGIVPSAVDRVKWAQNALSLSNRDRARQFLKEHKDLMPSEWTRRGRRKKHR